MWAIKSAEGVSSGLLLLQCSGSQRLNGLHQRTRAEADGQPVLQAATVSSGLIGVMGLEQNIGAGYPGPACHALCFPASVHAFTCVPSRHALDRARAAIGAAPPAWREQPMPHDCITSSQRRCGCRRARALLASEIQAVGKPPPEGLAAGVWIPSSVAGLGVRSRSGWNTGSGAGERQRS